MTMETAVAEIGDDANNSAVAEDGKDSAPSSVAGDTVTSVASDESRTAVEARREARVAPKEPRQGEPQTRKESSWWNDEAEVGNFGLFCGNWGVRGTLANARFRREIMDRQITRSPGQVIVLCEANADTEELLRQPRSRGTQGGTRLEARDTFEHWVQRGNEESACLIAARKDTCTGLDSLDYTIHHDHPYREKGKDKMAKSRFLTCKVSFRQNIGHVGKEVVVLAVHGHFRTMKFEWPSALKKFWDVLADKIRSRGVKFMAGDFNMSFCEVVKQLQSRGIVCDCCAWYPWRHATMTTHEQSLGLDSIGIFYIGGQVQVSLPWGIDDIDDLTAVADILKDSELDEYEGQNHPGQHWRAYRSIKHKEKDTDKDLSQRLRNLLTPSTAVADLQKIPKRENVLYCPFLRIKQKKMDRREWLVNDGIHNGAHFPLCIFTNNARARSAEKARERAAKANERINKGKGKNKDAEKGGKGKGSKSAVAEDIPGGSSKGKGDKSAVAKNISGYSSKCKGGKSAFRGDSATSKGKSAWPTPDSEAPLVRGSSSSNDNPWSQDWNSSRQDEPQRRSLWNWNLEHYLGLGLGAWFSGASDSAKNEKPQLRQWKKQNFQ